MSKALNRLLRRGRKLIDLEVSEISVVDKAAALDEHGRSHTFAIIKRAKADPALSKILEAFADEGIEDLLAKGDEKALKAALKAALEKLGPYLDGMPDDISAAIKTLASFAAGPPAAAADYGQPPEKKAREGEPFDSDEERAAFYKSKKKPFPDGGTLGDVMQAIVGAARPDIVAKWQARKLQKMADDGDLDPADFEDVVIEEGEDEPHAHALSKALRGQGDDSPDDDEDADPWPSLGGILNR